MADRPPGGPGAVRDGRRTRHDSLLQGLLRMHCIDHADERERPPVSAPCELVERPSLLQPRVCDLQGCAMRHGPHGRLLEGSFGLATRHHVVCPNAKRAETLKTISAMDGGARGGALPGKKDANPLGPSHRVPPFTRVCQQTHCSPIHGRST